MLNALLALSLAAAATAPQFQNAYSPSAPAVHVKTHDLDLRLASDRKRLDRRIASAIEDVCPPLAQVDKSTPSLPALRCRAEAKQRVEQQRDQALARAGAQTIRAGAPTQTADSR